MIFSISAQNVREVCKIGQGKECCRYIVCGPQGFQCAKRNDHLKNTLDARVEKMTAQSDNCDGSQLEVHEENGRRQN